MARLYLLRADKFFDKPKIKELKAYISKAELHRGDKTVENNLGRIEALGYIYRLERWIKTVYADKDSDDCAAELKQHSKHLEKELQFLVQIRKIPNMFNTQDIGCYYRTCFNIYYFLYSCYKISGMESESYDCLNIAVGYNELYRKSTGRLVHNSLMVNKTLGLLNKEMEEKAKKANKAKKAKK